MDNTGTIDQATGEAAGNTNTESSNGTGQAAPESSQEQETNAGGSQGFSESGKENGNEPRQPRFKSKNETIYELRQKIREQGSYWEQEVGTLKQQLSEIQKMFRGKDQKPSRTFWEAPEDVQRELTREELKTFKEDLLGELRQTQEERESAASLKQEASEAAKLIRSQKGITDDDIMEIRDILQSDAVARRMADSPMEQAEYVLYKWNRSKGVSDKSSLKAKAAGVTGAPPQAGGQKSWTEAEMESEIGKIGPQPWSAEQKAKYAQLEREFMSAYKENRVRKQ